MSLEENKRPSETAGESPAHRREAQEHDDDDVLIRALRELPKHEALSGRRIHAEARAAFVRAFDDAPWYAKWSGAALRAVVPAVLVSVVGLYLFWAFAAAISVNQ